MPIRRTVLRAGALMAAACLAAGLSAQAASPSPAASPSSEAAPIPPRERYLKADIESAPAAELRARLKALGLSEAGTEAELRARLLGHYGQAGQGSVPAATPAPTASPAASSAPAGTPSPSPAARSGRQLDITIESAGNAAYVTVEEVNETYLRLGGGVVLVVADKERGSTHRITADRITYLRDRDIMLAQGAVNYRLTEKGKDQTFQGSELRFSLGDMEVFLLDGVLNNKHGVAGQQLDFRIEGETISRSSGSRVVLDGASVTSSKAAPPSYHIKAGHIWLLEPGEWAIVDGVLHVGRVPVFWVPGFYFPADELFFNPVAGYQDPEGAFLQTTTYLLGRKPASQAPLSFMQFEGAGDNTGTRLHGLFLQKTNEAPPSEAPAAPAAPGAGGGAPAGPTVALKADASTLKLLLDAYTRYGYLVGLQGKLPFGSLFSLDFTLAAGFSRMLFKGQSAEVSTYYLETGKTEREIWDSGYAFGTELPLRFLADVQGTLQWQGLRLSLAVPLSGDPSFKANFLSGRKEDINWARLIGIDKSTATSSVTSGATDTMNMTFSLSWSPETAALRPFVESFGLSNLDASLNWNARTWNTAPAWVLQAVQSADKRFWVPELLVLPRAALSLSGTLLQYPWPASATPVAAAVAPDAEKKDGPAPDPLAGFPRMPPVPPGGELPPADAPVQAAPQPAAEPAAGVLEPVPPAFTAGGGSLNMSDWDFKLGYSLTPGLTVNGRFLAAEALSPLDMDSELAYWSLQDRLSGGLKLNVATPLSIAGLDAGLNLAGQDQRVLELNPAAPATLAATVQSEAVRNRYLTLDAAGTLRVKPLSAVSELANSSIEYGLAAIVYRQRWKSGLDEASALYVTDTFDFTKDFVTRHSIGLNLAFDATPFNAKLGGQLVLPPFDAQLNAQAGLGWGKVSLSAEEAFTEDKTAGGLKPGNLRLALNAPLVDWFSTSHNLEADPVKSEVVSYQGTVGLFGFNAGLQARRSAEQYYDTATRSWKSRGEETLRIAQGSLDYSLIWDPDAFWRNRIKTKFSLTGRYNQNFLNFTDSSLSWNFAWDFKVAEFLDLSASLGGQNTRIFRYFPEFNRILGLPKAQDRDFFTDLARSLNIFEADQSDRQASYFKMSAFSLKATHYLGDWTLSLTYTGQPAVQAINNVQTVVWNYQLAAWVAWTPITEVKTTVKSTRNPTTNKDELSLE